RIKDAVGAHSSLSHTAAAFLKQIGKNTFVNDGDTGRRISNSKADSQAILITLQRACLNQASDTERTIDRCFASGDLSWTKDENEIAAKCACNQVSSNAQCG